MKEGIGIRIRIQEDKNIIIEKGKRKLVKKILNVFADEVFFFKQ